METRRPQRKSTRGRKKRETNRRVDTMNAVESRTIADGNETGDHNMNIVPAASPKIENVSRNAEAGGDTVDNDMAAVDNPAVPKTENEGRDLFSEYFSRNVLTNSYHAIDETTTDHIMEEADILLAEYRENEQGRKEILKGILNWGDNATASTSANAASGISDNNPTGGSSTQSSDSNIATIVETPVTAAAAASANTFDESVFIVNDDGSSPLPTPIRQIATVDDEVILIDDEPDERVHVRRVTAVVDLCSPDSSSSNRRKRSHSPGAASRKMSDLSESMDETMAVGGMSCPVCMEKIKNGPPHSTICGHIFCGCCIKRAVGEHKKCPICNKRLTIKGIHPLYFT